MIANIIRTVGLCNLVARSFASVASVNASEDACSAITGHFKTWQKENSTGKPTIGSEYLCSQLTGSQIALLLTLIWGTSASSLWHSTRRLA